MDKEKDTPRRRGKEKNMKTYLLKVYQFSFFKNGYDFYVYKVTTDNIYRVIGKVYCTSMEDIKSINYSLWSQEREDFWIEDGYKIMNYLEPKLFEEY